MDGFGHLSGMGQPVSRGVSYQPNAVTVDLSQLKQGDVFKGEITAVSGEEVQLYLGNGQYMQARLEHDVQLALGQILNFQVQSNTGDKLVLKPLYQNAYQQRVGEAALKAAGIPVNEKNMQLIAKMIENGLPIHKESVGKLYRQMLGTPKASMEQLMQMNKIQLKVTPESLAQYQKYEGLQHSLTAAVQEMTDEVFLVYDALQNGEKGESVLQSVNVTVMKENAQIELRQTEAVPQGQADIAAEKSIQANGSVLTEQMTQGSPIHNTDGQGMMLQQPMDGVMFMDRLLHIMNGDKNVETMRETFGHNAEVQQFGEQSAPQQVADRLIQGLRENQLSLQDIEGLFRTKLSQTEFGTDFVREVKEKLFASETFRSRLQQEMEANWRLTPDEIMEDKTSQFYKRLYEQSNELSRLMNEAAQEVSVQTGSARNVQQNIEFMNQLNQVFQYVQLPLKLSENNAHGELYVFTNKRNLAKRDGSVTALLHLDMEHLGNMDIHVAMQLDSNQVTTRFAVQEEMLEFVGAHMDSLTKRLKEKGYTCNTSCEAGIEEKSVIEYVEEQIAGTTVPLMYQSFDIRA
ncbi:MAG: flagellar hook-length control protein FliK [Lachnospiraceae bacterium]|nr:flagellar hook-length control protein FliK [Lachnospiraceae bacterium]